MDDLDRIFAHLRTQPLPDALETVDVAVMTGLATARERLASRRSVGLACGVAAVVGLWGGLSGAENAHAHDRSLLAMPEAAPSHLLAP